MQHLPENLQAIDVSQRSSINKIVTWERPLLAANRIWPNRRRAGRFVRGVDQGSKFKETIRTTSEHRLGRRRAAAQSIVVIGERWQEPWGDQSRAAYGSIESERGDRSLRRMDPL